MVDRAQSPPRSTEVQHAAITPRPQPDASGILVRDPKLTDDRERMAPAIQINIQPASL